MKSETNLHRIVTCFVGTVTRLHVALPRYAGLILDRDEKCISSSTLTSGSGFHATPYWNGKRSSGQSV